jgi:hypothetical protein
MRDVARQVLGLEPHDLQQIAERFQTGAPGHDRQVGRQRGNITGNRHAIAGVACCGLLGHTRNSQSAMPVKASRTRKYTLPVK